MTRPPNIPKLRPGEIYDLPPPTTELINNFPRTPAWKISLLICAPVIAFAGLLGALYENPCPVRTGDRITGHGGAGEVRMIYHAGAGSRQCKAGIRWDSGETEAVEGWRLEVVEQ